MPHQSTEFVFLHNMGPSFELLPSDAHHAAATASQGRRSQASSISVA
jgi:hypothetical protein